MPDIRRRMPLSSDIVHALRSRLAPRARVAAVWAIAGRHFNEAYVVTLHMPSGGTRRVVVRRYARLSGNDRGETARREYRALELLHAYHVPAAQPLYLDESGELLGTPGIVVSFVPGRQIVAPADGVTYAAKLGELLARVHGVPVEDAANPSELLLDAEDEVAWFALLATPPERIVQTADGRRVYDMVRRLLPGRQRVPATLVHGDFWPGNILWDGANISAILDWEAAARGDPGIDVAYMHMNLSYLGLNAAAQAFLAAYEAASGREVEHRALWELCVVTRLLPDPARVLPQFRELGTIRRSGADVRRWLHDFVADACRRAGG